MKTFRFTMILVVLFSLSVLLSAQNEKPSVDKFGWLAGCWEMSVPQRNMTVTEQWMKPAGGTLIGMSRTVVNGKTVSYEYLRIATTETGIDYVAKPSQNTTETVFALVESGASELVFENLKHDFPQRIIYRQPKPDKLAARIEGTREGQLRGMDIPMIRVKCD